ncbi:MAG TPA: disulfide oxidoreductase [Patescibacteria group bacterium]|nr:disulfide oxidoreductase [Patescibacteria group bacterium]
MKVVGKNSHYLAFLVAFVATCGSLFFSEVLHYPPCVLCWYQRICMYPLVVILGVGIYFRDTFVYRTVLFLSSIGILISLYHNLLYYKILPEAAAPCRLGVSCTTKFIEWFGFVTIPFLSGMAFALIIIFMLFYRHSVLSAEKGSNKRK